MSNLKNILNSFHLKDELNPKIWKSSGNDEKTMNPKVRARLLDIAYEFIEFLKVDVVVSDIIMTGSLANYNWSTFSDIDLHILVDFNQFPESQLPLYTELFTLKKTMYNDNHNITIYGYEVELYIQNESETHFSSGVYSVLHDEWINKSKKENVEIDTNLIKNKASKWMEIIDGALENAQDEPLDDAKKLIQKYKDKIKKYRTCGLEKDGEYSDENLVFKVLRRNGYMQKLFDFENEYTDKKLSIKESTTNIGGTFLSDL
jgi:predicted nucleotidyltransferase